MALKSTDEIRRSADERRRFAVAWNKTMIMIWKERIQKLGVVDTGRLFASVYQLDTDIDADALSITEREQFTEYGIWQDQGVGREVPHGNSGDLGRPKVRQRRKWFSPKYYGSVMAMKDFMAESIGLEFVGMVAAGLDADELKRSSNFYRRKGYS